MGLIRWYLAESVKATDTDRYIVDGGDGVAEGSDLRGDELRVDSGVLVDSGKLGDGGVECVDSSDGEVVGGVHKGGVSLSLSSSLSSSLSHGDMSNLSGPQAREGFNE